MWEERKFRVPSFSLILCLWQRLCHSTIIVDVRTEAAIGVMKGWSHEAGNVGSF